MRDYHEDLKKIDADRYSHIEECKSMSISKPSGFKNQYSSFSNNGFILYDKSYKPLSKDESGKIKRQQGLDRTIDSLGKKILGKKCIDLSEKNSFVKILKYCLCLKYYANKFHYRDPKQIVAEEVLSLGHIYYLVQSPEKNETDEDKGNEDYTNSTNYAILKMEKKEEKKKTFIDKLLQNTQMAEKKYKFVQEENESQNSLISLKNIQNLGFISQKDDDNNIRERDSYNWLKPFSLTSKVSIKSLSKFNDFIDIKNSSMPFPTINFDLKEGENYAFNDNTIFLILKGKRSESYERFNRKNRNRFFCKFYLENMLQKTVEVISNNKSEEFKKITSEVKINDEIIIAFAYNPTEFFNVKNGKYECPKGGLEYVYFIDS